jgi:outer membrane protein assembly factor BamA
VRIASFIIIIFLFTGCFSTRHLTDGEQLLVKNKVVVEGNLPSDVGSFEPYLRQRPNRKILGVFRFHLFLYNVVSEKRMNRQIDRRKAKLERKNTAIDNKNILRRAKGKREKQHKEYKPAWREKWRTIVGERPTVLDTTLTQNSSKQIKNYLFKLGFFDAEVHYTTKTRLLSKKRVKAIYHVSPNDPYMVNSYEEIINDSLIHHTITELRANGNVSSFINHRLDIEFLDQQRVIISDKLQQLGFYDFNKEFITYQIDTNQTAKTAQLRLQLNHPKRREVLEDSVRKLPHRIYTIKSVNIVVEGGTNITETPISSNVNGFNFFFYGDKKVLAELDILRSVLFAINEPFNLNLVTQTRKRLSSMGLFEYVQIIFVKDEGTSRYGELACEIRLKLLKKQTVQAETKGTYTNGNYGIEGGLTYVNRNMFRGGEKLRLSVGGGLQTQQSFTSSGGGGITNVVFEEAFNTFEIGPKLEFTLPRMLFFNKAFKRLDYTQTRISANVNWQRTPDYSRNLEEYTFGYDWAVKKHNFFFDPIQISFVDIEITNPVFKESILSRTDLFFANSFIDHVIIGSRLRYKYGTSTPRGKFFLDAHVEGVGNALHTIYNWIDADTNAQGNYNFLGIQFAQFMKFQTELRYHYHISKSNDLAFRFNGGLGVPFRNSNYALPFEKSFFIGGPNSLRAWRPRTIGPGAYGTEERTFDKIGDIILEANAEYRFELTSTLEGAFFIDAGNIWLYDKNSSRVGGSFNPKTFLSEVAFGSGAGLRFDFTYFLLRFDLAIPIKTPYLPKGERWIFEGTSAAGSHFVPQLSFGIGYPF